MPDWPRREWRGSVVDEIMTQVQHDLADTEPAPVIDLGNGWQYRGIQQRPSMGPRAKALCRRCWEQPIASNLYDLAHVKYRYLCTDCRRLVTSQAEIFARALKVHIFDLLDASLKAVQWED